jgi:hypothetical protein
MEDIERHFIHLIPASTPVYKTDKREKQRTKAFPPAKTLARTDEACTIELQSPAPERGMWKITCNDCEAWAVVSVEHSVRDPKLFELPCGTPKRKEFP